MALAYYEPIDVEISRSMLEHLKAITGRVNDMFVAEVINRFSPKDVFTALHVIKTLLVEDFKFTVLENDEAQIIVKCSNVDDIVRLDAAVAPRCYKFGDDYVRIRKIGRLSLMPVEDDKLYTDSRVEFFPASYERLSREDANDLGFPTGYSDRRDDMVLHKNPRPSTTTLSLLGIEDGETEGLLKVNIKHLFTPANFHHVYHAIPWKSTYKSAIDQDGHMYLKFDDTSRSDFLATTYIYVGRYMIKFYKVDTVAANSIDFDKARQHRLHSRATNADAFEIVNV